MARPKGSKDKRPRKPRKGGPERLLPVEALIKRVDPKTAPNGLTVRGYPKVQRRTPNKAPKTPVGRKALQEHLIANGLLRPGEEVVLDKGGKPMIHLDPEEVKSLAKFGPTYAEIAAHFNVGLDIVRRYSDVIAEGRELGKLMIRKRARILAMEGNVPMLLHACKHALDEREAPGTTNIAVLGNQASAAALNLLSPETAEILAAQFQAICPDPSKFMFQEVQGVEWEDVTDA